LRLCLQHMQVTKDKGFQILDETELKAVINGIVA